MVIECVNRWLNSNLFRTKGIILIVNTGDTDVHGRSVPCKHRNRIFYILIMYNVIVTVGPSIFIILFYKADGGGRVASTAFQTRLEVLWRGISWHISFTSLMMFSCSIHACRWLWVVVLGDGWGRKLQAINFCVIKLGRLSREGSIPEIIWLIEGKPCVYFLAEEWLSNCELRSPRASVSHWFLFLCF